MAGGMPSRALLLALLLFLARRGRETHAACDGPRPGSLLSGVPVKIWADNASQACSWTLSASAGAAGALLSVERLDGDPASTYLAAYDGAAEDPGKLLIRLSGTSGQTTRGPFSLPLPSSLVTLVWRALVTDIGFTLPGLAASLSSTPAAPPTSTSPLTNSTPTTRGPGAARALVRTGSDLLEASADTSVTEIVVLSDITLSSTVFLAGSGRQLSVSGSCGSAVPCTITLPAGKTRGFSVRGGSKLQLTYLVLSSGADLHGAAVLVAGAGSALVASRVAFADNVASGDGGALMALDGAQASCVDCTFARNVAVSGGGGCAAAFGGASISFARSVFSRNAALSGPGGCLLAMRNASIQAADSALDENQAASVSAGGYGGSIAALEGASVTLDGVNISNSMSFRSGGGVYLGSGAALFASQTSLSGCSAALQPAAGGGANGGTFAAVDSSLQMESVDIADSFAANMGGCLSLHRSSYLAFSTTMRSCKTNMTGSAEGSAVLVNQSSSYACHGCLLEADSAAGRDIKVSLNSTLALVSTSVRLSSASGAGISPVASDCSAPLDLGKALLDFAGRSAAAASQTASGQEALVWASQVLLGSRAPCRLLEEFSAARGVCQCVRRASFDPASGLCRCVPGTVVADAGSASGVPQAACVDPAPPRGEPLCGGSRYGACVAAVVVGTVAGSALLLGAALLLRAFFRRRAHRNKQRELALEGVVIPAADLRIRHMLDDGEVADDGAPPKALSAKELLGAAFVEYSGMQVFLRRLLHSMDSDEDMACAPSARWANGDDGAHKDGGFLGRPSHAARRPDGAGRVSELEPGAEAAMAWALSRNESAAPHAVGGIHDTTSSEQPRRGSKETRRSTEHHWRKSSEEHLSSGGERAAPPGLPTGSSLPAPGAVADGTTRPNTAHSQPNASAVQLHEIVTRVPSVDKHAIVQDYLESAGGGSALQQGLNGAGGTLTGHLKRLAGNPDGAHPLGVDALPRTQTSRSTNKSSAGGRFGGGGNDDGSTASTRPPDLNAYGNFFSPEDNAPAASPSTTRAGDAHDLRQQRATADDAKSRGGGGGGDVPVILKRGASAQNAFYNKVYKEQAALHLSNAGEGTMRDLEFTVTGDNGGAGGADASRVGRRMLVTAMLVGAEGSATGPRRIAVTAPKKARVQSFSHAADSTFNSTDDMADVASPQRPKVQPLLPSASGRVATFLSGLTAAPGTERSAAEPGPPLQRPSGSHRFVGALGARVSFTLSRKNSKVIPLPPGQSKSGARHVYAQLNWQLSNLYELCHLRHPNIVRVFGGCSFPAERVDVLVEEHMAFGPLCELLALRAVSIEPDSLLQIAFDIAQGCLYLHDRDPPVVAMLTSRKVLISADLTAKIQLDFVRDQDKSLSMSFARGGVQHVTIWSAPEILILEEGKVQPPSDVYAFGLILYELFTRSAPFQNLLDAQMDPEEIIADVLEKDLRPVFPSNAGAHGIKNLAIDCWTRNPMRRPMFDEVIDVLTDIERKMHPHDQDGTPNHTSGGAFQPLHAAALSSAALPSLRGGSTTFSGEVAVAPVPMPALHDMMPTSVIEALKSGKRPKPEVFENVTVFFSDIVGFTDLSSALSPEKVTSMLDRLYRELDNLSAKYELFKAETIGDAFLAVAGIPHFQSDHVARVAAFALDAIKAANKTLVDLNDPARGYVQLRVGFHPGPLSAAVVGTMRPKYTVLGDTVNTASRMESNSEAGRANMSKAAADLLTQICPGIELESRGKMTIKGKGQIECFFLKNSAMNVALLQNVIKTTGNPTSPTHLRAPLHLGMSSTDMEAATSHVRRF